MDESKMNEWIDMVLWPQKEHRDANNPPVEPPIIILDAYHMHLTAHVVNCIKSMGIEVVHIPAGCAYLCKTIDVDIRIRL